MADDGGLRMSASVADKFSGTLKELQRLLKGAQQDSQKHSREQLTLDARLKESMSQNVRVLKDQLRPALDAIGLSTLSIGGAISAIAAGTANFGGRVRELSLLSQSAGMTVDKIRALEGVAAKFQISSDSIEQGVVSWSTTMDLLHRNVPEGAVAWFRTQAPNVLAFGEALKKTSDNMTALQMVFKELNTIENEAQRRTFLGRLNLPQEWAKMYGEDLPAAMRTWSAEHAKITTETQDNAKKWVDSWEAMKQAVVDLRDTFGPDLLAPMTKFFNAATAEEQQFVKDAQTSADAFRKAWQGGSPGEIGKSLLQSILGPEGSDERRLFNLLRGGVKAPTDTLPGHRPTGSEAPLNRGRDDDDALPLTSKPRSYQGPEETKKLIEGTREGTRQGLADYFLSLGTAGGGAGGIGGAGGAGGGGGGGMIGARAFGGVAGGAGGAVGGFRPSRGGSEGHGPGAPGDAMAPAGTGTGAAGATTEITSPSGRKFRVASEFAPNFQGFINDYEKAGGRAGPNSGGLSERPGNASYHPLGRAIDFNQTGRNVRGGGITLPVDQENALASKWGLRSGNTFRNPDTGHFEVSKRAAAAAALKEQLGGSPEAGASDASVRGGWYSQFEGKHSWRDRGDRPGSNALGVPDSEQGIALPSRKTLGQFFDVRAPNGKSYPLQQTDVGPAASTGRGVDISAAAAERMGYSPGNFPTDGKFGVSPMKPMKGLLPAAKQAGSFGPSKIEGGAKIQVDFSNMPKGIKTGATAQGVFDQVQVNRGETMKKATE